MIKMKLLVFLLLPIFCLLTPAHGVPSIPGFAFQNNPASSPEVNPDPPSPYHLQPNWWQYFAVDNWETLQRRILATVDYLEKLKGLGNPSTRQEVNALLDRTIAQFRTLLKAKKDAVNPPFEISSVQKSYTVEEYLELVVSMRRTQSILDNEASEIKHYHVTHSKNSQLLDNLYVSYQKMPDVQNVEKLSAGLEIIALRVGLSIAEEELRIAQQQYDQHRSDQARLKDIIEIAASRLNYQTFDGKKADDEIESAKRNLEKAQTDLWSAESEVAVTFAGDSLDRANRRLTAQKIITASIKEAVASISLAYFEVRKGLNALNAGTIPNEEMEQKLKMWEVQVRKQSEDAQAWAKDTNEELSNAGKAIVSIEPGIANRASLISLHQQRQTAAQESLLLIESLNYELTKTSLLLELLRSKVFGEESFLSRYFLYFHGLSEDFSETLLLIGNYSLFKIGGTPVTPFSIIKILVILLFVFWISKGVRATIMRMSHNLDQSSISSLYTLSILVQYTLLLVGIGIALASIGIDFSSLAIVLGALSVGIGFGLQTIVNNFLSGLIILFSRNLRVGDLIELETGKWGKVAEINAQSVTVHTPDGIDIIVPNAQIISNKITNWTLHNTFQRLRIPFSVIWGTNVSLVEKVIAEAATHVPATLRVRGHGEYRDPEVWLVKIGEGTLDFELIVWVDMYRSCSRSSLRSAYLCEIERCLREHDIELAMPNRNIHLKTVSNDYYSLFRYEGQE